MRNLDRLIDKSGHFLEVFFTEASGGERRRAQAQASGSQSTLVAGHCVLVQSDSTQLANPFRASAVHLFRPKVHQHHVSVGAAGHDGVAEFLECGSEGFGVAKDFDLILAKLGRRRLQFITVFKSRYVATDSKILNITDTRLIVIITIDLMR